MNYKVYKRNASGGRGSEVSGIVSIKTTLRSNEPIKWSITGSSLTECPISENSEIVVDRNSSILFCGYVQDKKDKYDTASRIYDWELTGYSDLGKLSRRLAFPNPASASPDPDATYSATGYLSTVLLNAIKLNAGQSALSDRQLANLTVSSQSNVGTSQTVESNFDDILKFVQEKLTDTDLTLRETWNSSTGKWDVKIGSPVDVSSTVVFSVDNGSISSWERTVSMPKANWLLVTGCEVPPNNNKTMSVIVSDYGSVLKWGRIEGIVRRADIKRIVEKDSNGNVTYEEPWPSVVTRLQTAAYEELEKATAQFGYKLTTTEINRNVFRENYDIDSIVSVRVGGDEFKAKVNEIKITYSKGVETIVPSVGTLQKGELQSVFDDLGALNEQIKVLQKTEIAEQVQVQEVKAALTNWVASEPQDDDDPVPADVAIVAQKVTQVKAMVNRLKSNVRDMLY